MSEELPDPREILWDRHAAPVISNSKHYTALVNAVWKRRDHAALGDGPISKRLPNHVLYNAFLEANANRAGRILKLMSCPKCKRNTRHWRACRPGSPRKESFCVVCMIKVAEKL